MTTEQLSGRELDEALARALGWEYDAELWEDVDGDKRPGWRLGAEQWMHDFPPAAYSSSVDALREPEAKLIAAGWERETNTDKDGTDTVWFAPGGEPAAWAHDPVEAASRALAVHAGLTAIAAIEEEAK